MIASEIYSFYNILKEISSFRKKKKELREINFGIITQEYFNERKGFNTFFYELRDNFLETYKSNKTTEILFNNITEKCLISAKELNKTSSKRKSIAILTARKALKGKFPNHEIERKEKKLEKIRPLLISLEESLKNIPDNQELSAIKNLFISIKFSNDDGLERKFKRLFFLFIDAYEKTPMNVPYLQLYLTDNNSSEFSNIIQTMIEKYIDNPFEYSKKINIFNKGLISFGNPNVQKKELEEVERYIRKNAKKFEAKKIIQAFYSFKYFMETNYYGIYLFLLAWNEKLLDKNFIENRLDIIEKKLDELIRFSS